MLPLLFPALLLSQNLAPQGPIVLPGSPPIGIDYVVYDPSNDRVWVPAGNTGKVDVIDAATGKVTALAGLATAPNPRADRPALGPSSAAVAEGVVWVGNRADRQVCSFDAKSLAKRSCTHLPGSPDGLAYVAQTKELWVTTPGDRALRVVGADGKVDRTVQLEGAPEGYAVDSAGGRFFTNLEDQDQTLAIDVKSGKVAAHWEPGCGKEGPRGLVFDADKQILVVACTDGLVSLDLAHGGKVVGRLPTGKGVDNLDYRPADSLIYAAAGAASTLTVARLAAGGALSQVASYPTAPGARNAVVDSRGVAFVPNARAGQMLVIAPSQASAK